MSIKALRTPDEQFEELPGYPYEPKYVDVGDDLRMHYVDQGPREGWPVLMLHGEPSWSYLYRHMIRIFAEAGYRAIAPDLIGFGRSDKPAAREDYTYARHIAWTGKFITELNLRDITLVAQDWGGLIGLRLVAMMPQRFKRVVVSNTFLPTGEEPPTEAFLRWLALSQEVPELEVSRVIQAATTTPLSEQVLEAYDAPFPDETYKAGARQFPVLVPTSPSDPESDPNKQAWEVLRTLDIPFLTAFSDSDPITRGMERQFQEEIPGAHDQAHVTIAGGGHFLQEDRGPELAYAIMRFCAD